MSSRGAGAALALIAAAFLAVSVATPVVLPGDLALFAGHPTVDGHTLRIKDVYVGLLDAQLCNTGGDGRCTSGVEQEKLGFRVAVYGELATTGLLAIAAIALAALTIQKSERRKSAARLVQFASALTIIGAAAMLVQGPFPQATIPIGIGMPLYGTAVLGALIASLVAVRPPPPLKLRVADRDSQPLPVRTRAQRAEPDGPAEAFDVQQLFADEPRRGDRGRESRTGRDARGRAALAAGSDDAAASSDPFAPPETPSAVDRPPFQSSQLRPLYDATPQQGGTGGLLPIERPALPFSPPAPVARPSHSAPGVAVPPPLRGESEARNAPPGHGARAKPSSIPPQMSGPQMSGPQMSGPQLSGQPMHGPQLSGQPMHGPQLSGQPMHGPQMSGPQTSSQPMHGPHMSGPGQPMHGSQMSGQPMHGSQMSGPGQPMHGPQMSGQPMHGSQMSGQPMHGPQMSGASSSVMGPPGGAPPIISLPANAPTVIAPPIDPSAVAAMAASMPAPSMTAQSMTAQSMTAQSMGPPMIAVPGPSPITQVASVPPMPDNDLPIGPPTAVMMSDGSPVPSASPAPGDPMLFPRPETPLAPPPTPAGAMPRGQRDSQAQRPRRTSQPPPPPRPRRESQSPPRPHRESQVPPPPGESQLFGSHAPPALFDHQPPPAPHDAGLPQPAREIQSASQSQPLQSPQQAHVESPPTAPAPARPLRASIPMPARSARSGPTQPPPTPPPSASAPNRIPPPRSTLSVTVPPPPSMSIPAIPAIPAIPPIPALPKRAEPAPEAPARGDLGDVDQATISRVPIEITDNASPTNVSYDMPTGNEVAASDDAVGSRNADGDLRSGASTGNTAGPAHLRATVPFTVPDTQPTPEPISSFDSGPRAVADPDGEAVTVPARTRSRDPAPTSPAARDRAMPRLPITTAPDSLPPPKDNKQQASGPSPACPQCESPMAWVEEHLRFYCKSCRMYF